MIDFEVDIYDKCARAVLAKYPKCLTSAVNVNAPASFPAISIIEADSAVAKDRLDSSGLENAVLVAYDINVYSNLRKGARDQAKKILSIVDDLLVSLNFRRTFRTQGADSNDSTIYHVSARYVAGIDRNGKIYRR